MRICLPRVRVPPYMLLLVAFLFLGCAEKGSESFRHVTTVAEHVGVYSHDPHVYIEGMREVVNSVVDRDYHSYEALHEKYVIYYSIARYGVSLLDWRDGKGAEEFLLVAASGGSRLAERHLAYLYAIRGDFSSSRKYIGKHERKLMAYVAALETQDIDQLRKIMGASVENSVMIVGSDWNREAREILFFLKTLQYVLSDSEFDACCDRVERTFRYGLNMYVVDESGIANVYSFMLNHLVDLYLLRLEKGFCDNDQVAQQEWKHMLVRTQAEASRAGINCKDRIDAIVDRLMSQ